MKAYQPLTRRDRKALRFALNLAIEWEASLSSSYPHGSKEPVVARCARNIKTFKRLRAKVEPK